MKKATIIRSISFLLIILIFISCVNNSEFKHNYKNFNQFLHETDSTKKIPKYLKAHLKNGDVAVLEQYWSIDNDSLHLKSKGKLYNLNREFMYEGELTLNTDSVLIYETNDNISGSNNLRIASTATILVIDFVVLALCITIPKSCYGSCPTFYINDDANFHYSDAEGFSNAISPSLEYSDIDAIDTINIKNNLFALTMKNEALETHYINKLNLYSIPVSDSQRVFQTTNEEFYLCDNSFKPRSVQYQDSSIIDLLKDKDYKEWFSYSDPNNLSSKEEIFLDFENTNKSNNLGFLLNFRQSLMTTYLIYNAISYMGDEVSDIFAKMEAEKNTKDKVSKGLQKELGDIDLFVWDDNSNDWIFQGGFHETGPIAINEQMIKLKNLNSNNKNIRIKLRLNKGLWRIDNAELTNIIEQIHPKPIYPSKITKNGITDEFALSQIIDDKNYLVNYPGNEYKLYFDIPQNGKNEIFLESKGYYIEWMRKEWLKDKDLFKLYKMVEYPKSYLKYEAKNFKLYEKQIEVDFWNSKIDTKTITFEKNK